MKTKNLFLVTIVMLFGVVVKSSGQTNNNTVVGINANAPGTNNVALGFRPLFSNVSGTNNIGIGSDAMYYLQNGHNNIAIGNGAYGGDYASLPNPVIYTNGSGNISFGLEALRFNFNGNGNIAMGSNSGWNSKGSSNIFIGNSSGSQSNVVSNPNDYNIAIGQGSGSVLNGSYNILMGYGAQNLAPYEHFYLNIGNAIFGKNILGKDSNFGDWNIGAPIRIGIGQSDPGNTLDIKSSNLGLSGLRFSNLNNTFNPTTSASKFLTVDGNGDVVLSNLAPTTSNGTYWDLTGNSGTNSATNFLGTTDNVDLVFRRYNLESGRIGSSNLSLGYGSKNTGINNINIGTSAGSISTSPLNDSNISIGLLSGSNSNLSGDSNIFLGSRTGQNTQAGRQNVFLGYQTGSQNTQGSGNTFLGHNSGSDNTVTNNNIAIGNTSGGGGTSNIAIGHGSALGNTGQNNIFIGEESGYATGNTSGNVFIGYRAGKSFFGNDKLIISGNSIANLIEGDFLNRKLKFNVNMGTANNSYLEINGNPNASGLKFTNLNSNSNTSANPLNKVLSVNDQGDVILVNDAGTSNTGNFWGLNGNAGTTPSTALTVTSSPATSFLGTTDNQDLVFRRNNIRSGIIRNGTAASNPGGASFGLSSALPENFSLYLGNFAGGLTTGTSNTYVGCGAGAGKVSGNGNVYIGARVASTSATSTTEDNTLRIHGSFQNPLILGNFGDNTGNFSTSTRMLRFNVEGANSTNVVSINTKNSHSATSGVFDPTLRSGLRFDDYSINSNAASNSTSKFLTLNATGDVILMNLPTAASTDTDDQTLALTGNVLSISEGNSVTLPAYVDTDTDDQNLSISGNQLTISEGNTVTLPADIDTDDQTLSITGNVLTISEGNNVTLPNTNIIPGNNVTIVGDGSTATPFQISSNDTSLYANNGFINAFTTTGVNRVVNLNNRNIWFNSSTSPTNGRIYIGSNATYPTEKGDYRLYVEGGILTEKVRVAIPGGFYWADYVFANDYKLMPLNELENYIKENKHLPGIESADELTKGGLDLGNMQAKQMEKIEELTLHLIDQNKTLESQAKEIEELKAQMKLLLEKK